MCMNCTTSTEALAFLGAGGAAMASHAWQRLCDRIGGRSRLEREEVSWVESAAFLRSLGHDPEVLLGARPAARDAPAAQRAEALDGLDGELEALLERSPQPVDA